jgi:hypothetical protein
MMLLQCDVDAIQQLKQGPVWDGDLISKPARNQLVKLGIAQRCRMFEDGPHKGLPMNELTPDGLKLAAVMLDVQSRLPS